MRSNPIFQQSSTRKLKFQTPFQEPCPKEVILKFHETAKRSSK